MPKSKWEELIAAKPEHTQWFIDKFAAKTARGEDILREARFVNALVRPKARILDAGCGFGRHSQYLLAQSHQVVGIDVDPGLIKHAQNTIHGGTFINANLDNFEIPANAPQEFDAIFAAGNVVTFFHPDTRIQILKNLADRLAVDGRLAVGFAADRGYPFADFLADAKSAGLKTDQLFSTWDLRPFTQNSTFMVALLSSCKALPLARINLLG